MPDPRIQLKNQYLAAGLAYLLPGAGHLYQGRTFKGVLYLACIASTYLFGLYLSEGKAVYWRWEPGNKNIPYFAQAGVGLVAIPAIIQHKRFMRQADQRQPLELPLSAEFHLQMEDGTAGSEIVGRIRLDAVEGEFGREIRGTFRGTQIDEDGREMPLELMLAGPVFVEDEIAADKRRKLRCEIVEVEDGHEGFASSVEGFIPRPFVNRFAVPLADLEQEDLNRRLGRYFELAKVFTMIAGLLNVLAVWDALEGPAYGYGDEEESTDKSTDEKSEKSDKVAVEVTAADSTRPASVESGESQPAEAEEPVV